VRLQHRFGVPVGVGVHPPILPAVLQALAMSSGAGPGQTCINRREDTAMPHKIVPNLWFDTQAEDAANFYVSVFKNSQIVSVTHYNDAGPREAGLVLTVEFELDGERFVAINGGPEFTFDEAVSFQINCADQEEIDYFWTTLSAGGQESACGWLKDRYGLSWQVAPTGIEAMITGNDERSVRAMKAMLGMGKIDIAALQAAADGR
jgi:predicted 3-demethylubiquinone-9 3-methyltransferase (glyoxalase superfamily)